MECLLALLVGACAHGMPPRNGETVTGLPDDREVFEQVLARLDSLPWSSASRLADPGLLKPDPAIDMPGAADFIALPRSDRADRASGFSRMGVDTTSLVNWEKCGYRLPGDPRSTSCPPWHSTVLTIARARPARERFPFPFPQSGPVDNSPTKPGEVAVRVVLTDFSPDGRLSDTALDLILARGESGWRVTAQIALAVIN
ncbi:MAG: hypothetical protein U0974_00355 [Gemmatimonadales bacterium]|nr:hypothetical protein [Gemmatimonadales bacterium]